MKKTPIILRRSFLALNNAKAAFVAPVVVAMLLFPAQPAHAQFREWVNGGSTNWSTAANWSGGSYTFAQLEWKGNGSATSWNDLSSPQSQWRFYFSGGTAYTLGGNAVHFFDNSGANGGILSDSTALQTINMPLSFRDNGSRDMFIFTRNTGGLTFGGAVEVTSNVTALGIGGTNTNSVITFSGGISGNKPIVIGTNAFDGGTAGMGTTRVVFGASNSYSGTTTVNLGRLIISNNNSLGDTNSGTTVNAGGTLQLGNVTVTNEALTLNGLGNGDFGDASLLSGGASGSTNVWNGTISINGGEARINANNNTTIALGGTLTSATNRTLYIGGQGTTIISNALSGFNNNSGNGALYKDATGTLILLADNSTGLTGKFAHQVGTVVITNANNLGSGQFEFGRNTANRAILQVNASTVLTNAIAILNNSTNAIFNVTNNAAFTITNNLTQSGGTANTTKFGKAGAGTLVLGGTASTYNGQMQIGEGTVVIGASTALGANNNEADRRAIDLGLTIADEVASSNVTLLLSNGVTLTNSIYVSANTVSGTNYTRTIGLATSGVSNSATVQRQVYLDGNLTADVGAGHTLTFNRNITNTGGIIKTGDGILQLQASNNYTGGTVVNAGSLRVNNNDSLGTGAVTLSNTGAELRITATGVNIGNGIEVSDNGDLKSISAFATGGSSTFSGNITNNETTAGNFQIQAGTDHALTISGAISGSGGSGIAKTGSGTLVLSGPNTYNGQTQVRNGLVQLTGSLDSGTDVLLGNSVNSGVLRLGGASAVSQTVADLTVNGTGTANAVVGGAATASTLTVNKASGSSTFGGTLGGAGANENNLALTKSGAGTFTLTGSNSYTGATTVSNGRLVLNATTGAAAAGTASVSVASGASLLISKSEQVNDSATVSLSGGTIAKGSGAITETFGGLTLTATSFVDFGSGTGNFTFATYSPSSSKLTFQNFNLGNSLTINTGTFTASEFDFNGFGYSLNNVPTGGFTITAVPEPSTVLAALGLAGLMLWPAGRRWFARPPKA